MTERECTECGKNFKSSKEKSSELKCYECELDLITGGRAPEEGDFNTAKITSGTLTSEEEKWLMDDLRAVEAGSNCGYHEEYDDGYYEREYYESLFDPDARCERCDAPEQYCECCHKCGQPPWECKC